MNNALSLDRRRQYNRVVVGELTSERPPTIAERKARWYARIVFVPDYPLDTGSRQEHLVREYERQEMLDGREPELPF